MIVENIILKELREIKEVIVKNQIKYEKYMDIRQAVEYTSLSQSTIRRAINMGALKCSQKTGKLLFKRSSIDRWLDG